MTDDDQPWFPENVETFDKIPDDAEMFFNDGLYAFFRDSKNVVYVCEAWEAKHYCATELQSDEVTKCPVAEKTKQKNLQEQFQERQAAHRVETAGDYERIMRQLDALILDINDIKRKVRQWHHNT
jgi:hypothetical protein